jgi:pimeloyl-ACP methyl ester carboxylesterase
MRHYRAHRLTSVAALALCIAPPASGQTSTTPSLATRMVSVGGYAMRVQAAGLDTRVAGQPILVFQNGGGSSLETWGTVPARLAQLAPVVVYDRNTVGESEWDGEIGTPAHVTRRLWQLLATLGAEPPYVLVGWSWGGDLVRYHAGLHPDDVAGLVYIDPAGYSSAAEERVEGAIGISDGPRKAVEAFDAQRQQGREPDPRRKAESAFMDEFFETRSEADYGPVPAVPAALILAGRHDAQPVDALRAAGFPEEGLPLFGLAYHEAKLRERIARLGEWALAAPNGLMIVASSLGHAVHQEDPDLVVDAIRRIMGKLAAPGSPR